MNQTLSITDSITISNTARNFLSEPCLDWEGSSLGGLLSDGKYTWFSNGPGFVIVDSKNGNLLGKWTFMPSIRENSVLVKDIKDICLDASFAPVLIISLDYEVGGSICMFSLLQSEVLYNIGTTEKISSMHLISTNDANSFLPKCMQRMCGVLVLGLDGGDVLLVDLKLNIISNGENTRYGSFTTHELQIITPYALDEMYEINNLNECQHMAIHVNYFETDGNVPHFALKTPQGTNKIYVNKSEVAVSALHYSPLLQTLLVGYNFGSFQMWDLNRLNLTYTSNVHDSHLPISNFTVQEPVDDPRAFCYCWVVYTDSESEQSPFAHMYTLVYDKKEKINGSEYAYKNLHSCSVGLQLETKQFEEDMRKSKGVKCTNLRSFKYNEISLCYFVWTGYVADDKQSVMVTLFDLNQWYKEEMPRTYFRNDIYVSSLNLGEITTNFILNVRINEESLGQYLGLQHLEEHYQPSALSYKFVILSEFTLIFCFNASAQMALLNKIRYDELPRFANLEQLYKKCVKAGLIPLNVDVSNTGHDSAYLKEYILSLALEHQFVGWLCKCASSWCGGGMASYGCTLEFLLDWAWRRTQNLKQYADNICETLFDYSGMSLDENNKRYLSNIVTQLTSLGKLYQFILRDIKQFVLNVDSVAAQLDEVSALTEYFRVVQWMIYVNLLPEYNPDHSSVNVPYIARQLVDYYAEKRHKHKLSHSYVTDKLRGILCIDNYIEKQCGGQVLKDFWISDGGSGLYPPNSLQALLRIYLVSDLQLAHKHNLMLYFFMDLVTMLEADRYDDTIVQLRDFPNLFHLQATNIKLMRSFWELDHENYEEAVNVLLHPSLEYYLQSNAWVQDLLFANLDFGQQHKLGLYYIQLQQVLLENVEGVLFCIRLFVINNQLQDGLKFIRKESARFDERLMYTCFYNACQSSGLLKNVLRLILTDREEKDFFEFLNEQRSPYLKEWTAIYLIQRSRFSDIYKQFTLPPGRKPENRGLLTHQNLTLNECVAKIVQNIVPESALMYRFPQFPTVCHHRPNVFQKEFSLLPQPPVKPSRSTKSKLRSPENDESTPAKRHKLDTVGQRSTAQNKDKYESILKQTTPMIKRKVAFSPPSVTKPLQKTPQSILKFPNKRNTTSVEIHDNVQTLYEPNCTGINRLSVDTTVNKQYTSTAENLKPLARVSVRFDVGTNSSSHTISLSPSKIVESNISSEESKASEKFYSPNQSTNSNTNSSTEGDRGMLIPRRTYRNKTPFPNKAISDGRELENTQKLDESHEHHRLSAHRILFPKESLNDSSEDTASNNCTPVKHVDSLHESESPSVILLATATSLAETSVSNDVLFDQREAQNVQEMPTASSDAHMDLDEVPEKSKDSGSNEESYAIFKPSPRRSIRLSSRRLSESSQSAASPAFSPRGKMNTSQSLAKTVLVQNTFSSTKVPVISELVVEADDNTSVDESLHSVTQLNIAQVDFSISDALNCSNAEPQEQQELLTETIQYSQEAVCSPDEIMVPVQDVGMVVNVEEVIEQNEIEKQSNTDEANEVQVISSDDDDDSSIDVKEINVYDDDFSDGSTVVISRNEEQSPDVPECADDQSDSSESQSSEEQQDESDESEDEGLLEKNVQDVDIYSENDDSSVKSSESENDIQSTDTNSTDEIDNEPIEIDSDEDDEEGVEVVTQHKYVHVDQGENEEINSSSGKTVCELHQHNKQTDNITIAEPQMQDDLCDTEEQLLNESELSVEYVNKSTNTSVHSLGNAIWQNIMNTSTQLEQSSIHDSVSNTINAIDTTHQGMQTELGCIFQSPDETILSQNETQVCVEYTDKSTNTTTMNREGEDPQNETLDITDTESQITRIILAGPFNKTQMFNQEIQTDVAHASTCTSSQEVEVDKTQESENSTELYVEYVNKSTNTTIYTEDGIPLALERSGSPCAKIHIPLSSSVMLLDKTHQEVQTDLNDTEPESAESEQPTNRTSEELTKQHSGDEIITSNIGESSKHKENEFTQVIMEKMDEEIKRGKSVTKDVSMFESVLLSMCEISNSPIVDMSKNNVMMTQQIEDIGESPPKRSKLRKRANSADVASTSTKSALRSTRSMSVTDDKPSPKYNLRRRRYDSNTSVDTTISDVDSTGKALSVNIPICRSECKGKKENSATPARGKRARSVSQDAQHTPLTNLLETKRLTRSQKKLMEVGMSKSRDDQVLGLLGRKSALEPIAEDANVEKDDNSTTTGVNPVSTRSSNNRSRRK